MADTIQTRMEKIENYIHNLAATANQLKAASFVENDKMHGYAIKQSEILLNELDKEISNLKRMNITDELMEKEINTKMILILEEARKIVDKRTPQQFL